MPPTVTVVGDALLDVAVAPAEPMRPGADVPARIRLGPGGQGANLAVRLARRRIPTTLVCAVGDDAAGSLVRGALEAEGVVLHVVPAATTGTVVALLDPDGERSMLSARAAFADQEMMVPDADWLVISGYLLNEPGAGPLAARMRRNAPRRALVACAVSEALVGAWRAAAEAFAPDLVIANRDEAAVLRPSGQVLVTTHAAGAEARMAAERVTVTTPPGSAAVDTTGAGDTFAAALIAALPDRWPPDADTLRSAMLTAVGAAAAVTRVVGAQGRIAGERDARLDA